MSAQEASHQEGVLNSELLIDFLAFDCDFHARVCLYRFGHFTIASAVLQKPYHIVCGISMLRSARPHFSFFSPIVHIPSFLALFSSLVHHGHFRLLFPAPWLGSFRCLGRVRFLHVSPSSFSRLGHFRRTCSTERALLLFLFTSSFSVLQVRPLDCI